MSILLNTKVLLLALVASLAFNIGFVASRALAPSNEISETEVLSDCESYPSEFFQLCERLDSDLESLRAVQAQHTRELADLMTSEEPDLEAIESSLDCLAATERKIKGTLIHTVLTQRELLPADQRQSFCDNVRDRLCTPWEGCAPSTQCTPHECTKDQRGHQEAHGGKHDS